MATVHEKGDSRGYRTAPPARRRSRVVLAAIVLVAGLLVWFWYSLSARSQLDAAYGARVACSCHYVGARDFAGCEKEIAQETSFVFLRHDEDAKSVTASVPLLSSQTARFEPGAGCMLEKWSD